MSPCKVVVYTASHCQNVQCQTLWSQNHVWALFKRDMHVHCLFLHSLLEVSCSPCLLETSSAYTPRMHFTVKQQTSCVQQLTCACTHVWQECHTCSSRTQGHILRSTVLRPVFMQSLDWFIYIKMVFLLEAVLSRPLLASGFAIELHKLSPWPLANKKPGHKCR